MKINNRQKILAESITLFNQSGVVPVTTNHICRHLKISPGNLYFHFKCREDIIFELFISMCDETYALWKEALHNPDFPPPMNFIESTLEIFWKYRFFHREMYMLRRQDAKLNQQWQKHLEKTRRFMKAAYANWTKQKRMARIQTPQAMRVLSDLTLITASSFFQFYESMDKPATRKPLLLAREYMGTFLLPYFTQEYADVVKQNYF